MDTRWTPGEEQAWQCTYMPVEQKQARTRLSYEDQRNQLLQQHNFQARFHPAPHLARRSERNQSCFPVPEIFSKKRSSSFPRCCKICDTVLHAAISQSMGYRKLIRTEDATPAVGWSNLRLNHSCCREAGHTTRAMFVFYMLPIGLWDRPLPTYTVSGTRTLSRIV